MSKNGKTDVQNVSKLLVDRDLVDGDDLRGLRRSSKFCSECGASIETMCFRGTGVCSENCRKRRDHEVHDSRALNP